MFDCKTYFIIPIVESQWDGVSSIFENDRNWD